jgi:hypothetical protein
LGYSGDGGAANAARLALPYSIATAANGDYYVLDSGAAVVRKVSAQGAISTVAGNGVLGLSGDGGPALSASILANPDERGQVAIDGVGNLYVADLPNGVVRKVDNRGIITTLAGNGVTCNQVFGPCSAVDGGLANAGSVHVINIAVDQPGNVYIASDNRIWKVTTDGILHAFAGTGATGYAGDGGPALQARMNGTYDLTIDPNGNLYFLDYHASSSGEAYFTRKIDTSGTITTIPNSFPGNVCAVDGTGNIYGAAGSQIFKLDSAGHISVVANALGGNGFSGDNGPATAATFADINAIALDNQGNLLIADTNNQVVRKITFNPPMQASVTTNGSDHNLMVSAALQFSGSAAGKTDNLYVAAQTMDGALYFHSGCIGQ